ncbi:ATP-binding protein [Pyxidicoccus caerfyrddinensis]|uniref:sensor histidine kinase n=1 Tax=Pyxidicoccus caerfyrddinensis TaxID=2709663 RepID=UPI0013DAFE09|nr:ATP-binding protein [Pyxidicoccus caerfyrddinensis]
MQARRAGLLLLEGLAIIAGYVLLGWVGQRIIVAGRLVALWPAAGYALAILLLRGPSRWPAILLGSLIVSELWLLEVGGTSSPRGHVAAILTGGVRALTSVVGARLIRWQNGPPRWPGTVRGAVSFVLIAGLIYPAVVAVATHYSMWLSGNAVAARMSLHSLWGWFIANSTGALVVAPLILVFAAPSMAYPRRPHWELALLGSLYLVGSFASIELGRWLGLGGLMAYPLVPLMIWAALRFGSRGAAVNNLIWAAALIVFALSNPSSMETAQVFFQTQARIVVFSAVILVLAAAIEDRQQMREALEEERQSLEQRVAERTRDLARSLSLQSHARQSAEQAYREARQALGLRDEFLAIAAHELRTPLTSMKAQIQHLERLLDNPSASRVESSRLRSAVASTSQQLRRFQYLCDQLLDITRLTLGRLELRYERLDLRGLVEEQMGLQAGAASSARSELRLECAGPIVGEWDRGRLEQIVCNLLSNAIKFGAGSPITLRLQGLADHVRLQVIDGGIGIAPGDHARIFHRLERAVDSRHYGGLGLGLWIVRQSAEALGGAITVESELGRGSTFTVELPRTREEPVGVTVPGLHDLRA